MKKVFPALFFLLIIFFIAHGALADIPPGYPIGQADPTMVGTYNVAGKTYANTTDFTNLIVGLINWFAWFIALTSVVMGLYAGFLFITARGEPSQVATGRKILLYAVIGIAVAIASFSIVAITKAFI